MLVEDIDKAHTRQAPKFESISGLRLHPNLLRLLPCEAANDL